MRRILALVFITIFVSSNASAFKPGAHVWIAQQVLNDVEDGKVTIEPFGEFPVSQTIVDALKHHPAEYRMGHIGPDALPDLIVGQSTIHPGKPIGANDWFRFVLDRAGSSEPNLAFALGFAGHGAGDVFAHTYINLYVGDFFDLPDGPTEEIRHVALESYIDQATPRLVDPTGAPLGEARDVIALPADFARDVLIYDAADHHRAIPQAIHLVAMADFRRVVNDQLGQLEDFETHINTFYLQPNVKIVHASIDIVDNANREIARLEEQKNQLQQRLDQLPVDISNAENATSSLDGQLQNAILDLVQSTAFKLCRAKCCINGCGGCNEACESDAIKDIRNRLNNARTRMQQLNNDKAAVIAELNSIPTRIDTERAKIQAQAVDQVVQGARKLVDDIEKFLQALHQLSGVLRIWRDDIDRSVSEYALAGQATIQALMGSGQSVLQPYRDWLPCSAPVFKGEPSVLTDVKCAVDDRLDDFKQKDDELRAALGSAIWLVDPIGQAKREVVKRIRSEIERMVERAASEILERLGQPDIPAFLRLVAKGADRAALDAIFSTDNSGKGLLIFDLVSRRIDSDMALHDGAFSPTEFNAAHDAVVLSKLSLLDAAALNDLASKALGLPVSPFDGTVFRGVLVDMPRSIDGNHQWQQKAPPYFRRAGFFPIALADFHEFGHEKGLPLWTETGDDATRNLRKLVFERIFAGPVAPALENPCRQFTDLIHPSYRFRTCKAQPFADSTKPGSCSARNDVVAVNFRHEGQTFAWVDVAAQVRNTGGLRAGGVLDIAVYREEERTVRPNRRAEDANDEKKLVRIVAAERKARISPTCDGEEVTIAKLITLPKLPPAVYHVRATLLNDRGDAVEVMAPESLNVTPCSATYTVTSGDTLWMLSRRFGVSPWLIAGRNRIYDLNRIRTGRKLCIP